MILDDRDVTEALRALEALGALSGRQRGAGARGQPVHTVYGGAHLFEATSAAKLGRWALRHFDRYFPTFVDLGEALEIEGHENLPRPNDPRIEILAGLERDPLSVDESEIGTYLAATVHRRVREKLATEAVEDYRIDFAGSSWGDDEDEDDLVRQAGHEAAEGLARGTLPRRLGVRLPPLHGRSTRRATRTLSLFFDELARRASDDDRGPRLPAGFTVALSEARSPAELEALSELLAAIERRLDVERGSIGVELIVDSPSSVIDRDGRLLPPLLIDAAGGRCRAVHLAIFEYNAACEIVSAEQGPRHPVCDHVRHVLQVQLMGLDVDLVDGPSHHLPIGPYRQARGGPPLTGREQERNRWVVHRLSKATHDDIRHVLSLGIYQGWDIHPAQLPIRYATVYAFFLERLREATRRLRSAVDRATRIAHRGDRFEDEATARGLLAFFRRGYGCGALRLEDLEAAGLEVEELGLPTLRDVLEARQRAATGQSGPVRQQGPVEEPSAQE